MATIRRGTIVKDTIDALKLQVGNNMPNETSDKFVLTYDFSNVRVCDIVANKATSLTGSVTVYTIPAGKTFFLNSISLATVKDATSDGTDAYVTITPKGKAAVPILNLPGITTTAQNQANSLSFQVPIVLEAGSSITVVGNTTAGVFRKSVTITGFEVEA